MGGSDEWEVCGNREVSRRGTRVGVGGWTGFGFGGNLDGRAEEMTERERCVGLPTNGSTCILRHLLTIVTFIYITINGLTIT